MMKGNGKTRGGWCPAAVCCALLLCTVVVSCRNYETGDGDYSYLRADFAMLNTNSDAKVVSFVTDDDATVHLAQPLAVEGAKADTAYRAVVYYNANETPLASITKFQSVGVCIPYALDDKKETKTDPLGWESMWISANRSYVNLSLNLLTGSSDGGGHIGSQRLGVRLDRRTEHRVWYTLSHDQNNVPEYYTNNVFLSFAVDKELVPGDSITVTANTYGGEQVKTVVIASSPQR